MDLSRLFKTGAQEELEKMMHLTPLSRTLLRGIDGTVSLENEVLAIALLNELQQRGLVTKDSIIGSDGEVGVSLRWPEARMFCEVWEYSIHTSIVPMEPSRIDDIIRRDFQASQILRACDYLEGVIKNK
jgi:hypothetical protein